LPNFWLHIPKVDRLFSVHCEVGDSAVALPKEIGFVEAGFWHVVLVEFAVLFD
jgi:hypothetical protein